MEGPLHDRGNARPESRVQGRGRRSLIVSASYRTDIPAFHGARFLAQLDAGEAVVHNPYGGRDTRVSLRAEDVDGFIFWTRNTRPFRQGLSAARRIAPFFVQYTVTGYPQALEMGVPPARHAVEEIRSLSAEWGKGSVVWRYDPVIWTDETDTAFHLRNFCSLAERLADCVDEVVFSAATLYAKSRRNLKRHAPDLSVHDPDTEEKSVLLKRLGEESVSRGLTPTLCSQPDLLQAPLTPAKCVDADRLRRIGGADFKARMRGNRPGCACAESRDIGHYDSCAHGCLYCYAVNDHVKARGRILSA